MNRGVAAIWWGMLIATVFGVVPIVLGLLTRALDAARRIEIYSAEILKSGVGIANNTAEAAALKDTIAATPQLVAGAGSIEGHAATIRAALGGEPQANESSSDGTDGIPGQENGESEEYPAIGGPPESHDGEAIQ